MTNGCELSRWALIDRSARVLQHPGWVPNTVQEPMKNSTSKTQEGSDRALIEDIHKINYISLGEGAATCQVCGYSLREGEAVVVYVFRPAGEVMFQVGYVVCSDEDHELPGIFTLGVRELLVEGRIGVCSDEAAQSSWPVLLNPEVVAVSAAATKSVRLVPDGGSPSNGASAVGELETAKTRTTLSLEETKRRAGRSDGDVVRGLSWGEQR